MINITNDQVAALPASKLNDGYATKASRFFTEYYTCHANNGSLLEAARNQFDFLDTLFGGYYFYKGRLFVHVTASDEIIELNPIMLLLHIRADIKNGKHPLFNSKYYATGGIDGTYQRQVYQSKSIKTETTQTAEQFKQSRLQRTKTLDNLLDELKGVTSVKAMNEVLLAYDIKLSSEDEQTYKNMLELEALEAAQLQALTAAFGADKAKTILADIKASGKI